MKIYLHFHFRHHTMSPYLIGWLISMLNFLLLSVFLHAENLGFNPLNPLNNGSSETFQLPQNVPTIAGFSLEEVTICGQLSDIAYKINENDLYTLPKPGKIHKFATENEISGFIFEADDGKIYVSYKGTSSLRNVLTDLWCNWAFIDSEKRTRYHNGIMKGYQRTAQQVVGKLIEISTARGVDLKDLEDDLIFTGHSLGGGLAQIAANELRRSCGACARLATFAAPRVMDYQTAQEFNEHMGDRTITVSQATDPVCSVMLGTVFAAKHVGKKLLLPYHREILQHKMSGYLKALECLKNGHITASQVPFFNLRDAEKVFKFEESENQDGFGSIAGSNFIGNSYVPNPLGVLKEGRILLSVLVERPVHRVLSSVKDSAVAAMPTAQKAGIWTCERLVEATAAGLKETGNSLDWLLNTYKDLTQEDPKTTAGEKLGEAAKSSYGVLGRAVGWAWSHTKELAPKIIPAVKEFVGFTAKEVEKNVKATWYDYRNFTSHKLKSWGFFKKD